MPGFLRFILIWLAGLIWPLGAFAAGEAQIPPEKLAEAISARASKVEEFAFIKKLAEERGLHVYLFGGTAAGYAHYVKWDLQREAGDPRFQPDRFDYDYMNIYRSTQDLDMVVDGSADDAKWLKSELAKAYPHLQGSKTAWDVRPLRQTMDDKLPLLGDEDFLKQHNDSNSTGLIEITKPAEGESPVRDLKSWAAKDSQFLKDVSEGKLHYYFSPEHALSVRAKQGLNPPIFSAIRFLTKAFQYDLEIRPEDWKKIQKVVAEFDPAKDLSTPYAKNWIEKNSKKLIQNAVNIEYSADTLDRLGLRKKLAAIKGDDTVVDSLAWWMGKEPLRSDSVGRGDGKTAAEIFKEKRWGDPQGRLVVAHETNNFLAYESITRSQKGDPNVLVSRKGAAGEAAVFGDGFYTKVGREGAAGTGLTIRFDLDPKAREGTDFVLSEGGDYVVLRNKNAVRVIQESLNMDPIQYFEQLLQQEFFQESDRGIIEKFQRKIGKRLLVSPEMKEKISALFLDALKKKKAKTTAAIGANFPLIAPFLEQLSAPAQDKLAQAYGESALSEHPLTSAGQSRRLQFLDHIAKTPLPDTYIPIAAKVMGDIRSVDKSFYHQTFSDLLQAPHMKGEKWAAAMMPLVKKGDSVFKTLSLYTLASDKNFVDRASLIKEIVKDPGVLASDANDLIIKIFLEPETAGPEWNDALVAAIKRGNSNLNEKLLETAFLGPIAHQRAQTMAAFTATADFRALWLKLAKVFAQDFALGPEWEAALVELAGKRNAPVNSRLLREVIPLADTEARKKLAFEILEQADLFSYRSEYIETAKTLFSAPHTRGPEWDRALKEFAKKLGPEGQELMAFVNEQRKAKPGLNIPKGPQECGADFAQIAGRG